MCVGHMHCSVQSGSRAETGDGSNYFLGLFRGSSLRPAPARPARRSGQRGGVAVAHDANASRTSISKVISIGDNRTRRALLVRLAHLRWAAFRARPDFVCVRD